MNILFESDGWKAINRIGSFNEMYWIFIENYRELVTKILFLQDIEQPFGSRLSSINNLSRYIFNFLSSTSALKENCYNMMRFYNETDLKMKYESKKNELFLNSKLVAFIQKFRNYQTHFQLEFADLSANNQVILITEKLLQNSKEWNKLSLEYIQESGDAIVLKTTCEDYFKLVEDFYQWLYQELMTFHRQDIIYTRSMAKEYGIFYPNIG